ncbi:YxiG family protein, partial [Heyndrickxia faecalis]|uniref:YxiG family protein n=1 Tax=Heyndrickxia faecalis TaxID=2824910 RepID=UPI003D1C7ECB
SKCKVFYTFPIKSLHFIFDKSGQNPCQIWNFCLFSKPYLELTSIDFYMGGIGEIKPSSIKEDWVNQYYSNANFALEIWDALLLIEANSIIINGNKYPVT